MLVSVQQLTLQVAKTLVTFLVSGENGSRSRRLQSTNEKQNWEVVGGAVSSVNPCEQGHTGWKGNLGFKTVPSIPIFRDGNRLRGMG